MSEPTDEVVLRLTLGTGDGPLSGTVGLDGEAEPIEFSGWVELMAALEDLRSS